METTCEKCGGACCKTMLMPCNDPLAVEFFTARGAAVSGNIAMITSICRQLRHGKCKIYARRPIACSRYEVNGQMCNLTRKLAGIQ